MYRRITWRSCKNTDCWTQSLSLSKSGHDPRNYSPNKCPGDANMAGPWNHTLSTSALDYPVKLLHQRLWVVNSFHSWLLVDWLKGKYLCLVAPGKWFWMRPASAFPHCGKGREGRITRSTGHGLSLLPILEALLSSGLSAQHLLCQLEHHRMQALENCH